MTNKNDFKRTKDKNLNKQKTWIPTPTPPHARKREEGSGKQSQNSCLPKQPGFSPFDRSLFSSSVSSELEVEVKVVQYGATIKI